MKTFSKKSIVVTAVLLILTLSSISTNSFLVSAEAGGTGKFLEIKFISLNNAEDLLASECKVTATKVSSNQEFLFNATDLESLQKVGAGTVLLTPIPADGWEFIGWGDNVEPTSSGDNTGYYKTKKYDVVEAFFEKQTYTITVNVVSDDPDDHVVATLGNGNTYVIYAIDSPYLVTDVAAGDTPIFAFEAEIGNHISIFQVNGEFMSSALGYTFPAVSANQQITVYFSPDGEAYIPDEASGVPISLGNDVSLNFIAIETGGSATQAEIILPDELEGTSLILWNVNVEGVEFTGATVALPYLGVEPTHVYTSDDLDALYSDVDGNGIVDNADANLVAQAIATNGREYNAVYDVNRDLKLNSDDIQLVHDYFGTILESLAFEKIGDVLYISTGHFSIFRGR